MAAEARAHVWLSGRVQGVGFRFATADEARNRRLTARVSSVRLTVISAAPAVAPNAATASPTSITSQVTEPPVPHRAALRPPAGRRRLSARGGE